MEYIKLLEDYNVSYDTDQENWRLKNEREILRRRSGNCFDISYCAWRHFKNSIRFFIINLNHLNDDELASLKRGVVPETVKGSSTHCICAYIDTTWKGLHTNSAYIWWEYSWIKQRGTHKYKSMEDLLNDVIDKWQKESDYPITLITKITNTRIGCSFDEFVERGILSPIVALK